MNYAPLACVQAVKSVYRILSCLADFTKSGQKVLQSKKKGGEKIMPLNVLKNDNTTEVFDLAKIKSSILKAGGTVDQSESIATQVENWVAGAAVEETVKATDIRAKVLELLETANPEAATKFREYRKSV